REPERGPGVRRQETRSQWRVHPRRRLAEKLHAPDGTADSRSAGPAGKRTRLFLADYRRTPRHWRTERGHTAGGDDVGQGRSGAATRYGDVLCRFNCGPAVDDGVRAGGASAASTASLDGSPDGIDPAAGRRV